MAISTDRMSVSTAGKVSSFLSNFSSASESSKFSKVSSANNLFKKSGLDIVGGLSKSDKLNRIAGGMDITSIGKAMNSTDKLSLAKNALSALDKNKSLLGGSIGSKNMTDAIFGDCPDMYGAFGPDSAFFESLMLGLALDMECSKGLINDLLSATNVTDVTSAVSGALGKVVSGTKTGLKATNMLNEISGMGLKFGSNNTNIVSGLISKTDLNSSKKPKDAFGLISSAIGNTDAYNFKNNKVATDVAIKNSLSRTPNVSIGSSPSAPSTSDLLGSYSKKADTGPTTDEYCKMGAWAKMTSHASKAVRDECSDRKENARVAKQMGEKFRKELEYVENGGI